MPLWFLLSELPSFFCNRGKLESYKKTRDIRENRDFCNVIMPSENTKILQFNQYQKSDKVPSTINADHQCIIKKIDRFKNQQK